jgi:hypothetical protein
MWKTLSYMQIRSLFLPLTSLLLALLPTALLAQYFGSDTYGKERLRLGLTAGTGVVLGEIAPRFAPTALQGSLYLNRVQSRVVNYRFSAGFGRYMGLNATAADSLPYNLILNGNQKGNPVYFDTLTGIKPFYYSHSTLAIPLTAGIQLNLNRAISRLASDKQDLYLLANIGYMVYRTRLDATDANGQNYDFATLVGSITDPKDIRNALTNGMDGTYETSFESVADYRALIGDWRGTTTLTTALGYRHVLYSGTGIGFEAGITLTRTDLLDNEQWERGSSRTYRDAQGNEQVVSIFNANDKLVFARIMFDLAVAKQH